MRDPKTRFSDRVADYKKYRPNYPPEIISFILDSCKVDEKWKIADVGSGTGISSRLLSRGLQRSVYSIEPNDQMRRIAEDDEKDNPFFISVKGSAEATTLPDQSVNMVSAFQSFHWFDKTKSKKEFQRILRSPRLILLVWNDRMTEKGFLEEYENLLKTFPEYQESVHKTVDEKVVSDFLGNTKFTKKVFRNNQEFDFEGLKGRLSSSSYAPQKGSSEYQEAETRLKKLFEQYSDHGLVEMKYETRVFLGQLS